MRLILTTDTHFNHKKLIEYGRPENFEDLIKKELMRIVLPSDILIHLGDVCIGKDIDNNNWFKNNLKCRTFLVLGNHDNKSTCFYLRNGWDCVSTRLDINIFGKKYCFSHYPTKDDGSFDINYHGHFHNDDHRSCEEKFKSILSDKNHLISLERTNYLPIILK
jgi:calcineurin-like phosphoesterase family protein